MQIRNLFDRLWVQVIISAVQSAMRGGLIFSRSMLKWAKENGYSRCAILGKFAAATASDPPTEACPSSVEGGAAPTTLGA